MHTPFVAEVPNLSGNTYSEGIVFTGQQCPDPRTAAPALPNFGVWPYISYCFWGNRWFRSNIANNLLPCVLTLPLRGFSLWLSALKALLFGDDALHKLTFTFTFTFGKGGALKKLEWSRPHLMVEKFYNMYNRRAIKTEEKINRTKEVLLISLKRTCWSQWKRNHISVTVSTHNAM